MKHLLLGCEECDNDESHQKLYNAVACCGNLRLWYDQFSLGAFGTILFTSKCHIIFLSGECCFFLNIDSRREAGGCHALIVTDEA